LLTLFFEFNFKSTNAMAKTKTKLKTVKKSTKKVSKEKPVKANTGKVLRFAHPFFTPVDPAHRTFVPGVGKRMTDYVATKLEPIPSPQRDPTMGLSEIVGNEGAAEIAQSGSITFHSTGDTGEPTGNSQQMVADAMSTDYNANKPSASPAFFLHLGDVNYFENNDKGYHAQFYEPYKKYPGKIIAIPGNHDGELFKYDHTSVGQKKTLEAFMANFCLPKPGIPPAAGTIYREMVSQPGVYWLLDTPFVHIIGLYSNIAEGPGYISCKLIGNKQKDWFTKTLAKIQKERVGGKRKGLIFAVHHPPFSNGGHESSTDMLNDIDDCCHKSGIMPDVVLAGHAHNYQRYTRFVQFNNQALEIPFVVCGCGGRVAQPVKEATGIRTGDHRYDKSYKGYGYLKIKAEERKMNISFIAVSDNDKRTFDEVSVGF
jgi:hypothetical protein